MKGGVLLQRLEPGDAGAYVCTAREHSFSRPLARYTLRVIARERVNTPPAPAAPAARGPAPPYAHSPRSYKELQLLGVASLSADEYCEQLWWREKRRQQKLRSLKWKQQAAKARVRRHGPLNPPVGPGEGA